MSIASTSSAPNLSVPTFSAVGGSSADVQTFAFESETLSVAVARWMAVIMPSLAVTALLILFMQRLIFVEFVEPDVEPTVLPKDLHYVEPPLVTHIKEVPEKVEEPQEQPPKPLPRNTAEDPGITTAVAPHIRKKLPIQKIGGMSSIPVALYMVSAKYPSNAIRRNIEGYVDLRFDIDVTGAPQNIDVIGAEPEGIFERAAIDAVSRWRYKPKLVDGKPEFFTGAMKRIRFEMEK